MKSLTGKILTISILLFVFCQKTFSQVDPALTGAVVATAAMEKKIFDKMNEEQKKMTNLQTAVSLQLEGIRQIQKKTFDYLTNITGAIQNAIDIKKAGELTVSIGKLCIELKDAVNENPQGFIVSTMATNQITKIKQDVVGIYAYIAGITLNKKTLLNSAERLVITTTVVHKLRLIYQNLYTLIYQVRAFTFKQLPQLIAPDIYYSLISRKTIAENIINSF